MAAYKVYLVDAGGRVRIGGGFEAADDAEAIARFRAVERHGDAAELWQGGRMVAGISVQGVFSPGPQV